MTSSTFFSRSSNSINFPLSSIEKLPNHPEKLISLFRGMVPISNGTSDCRGNHSRLWVLKNGTFLGIVSHSDGKISFLSSNKIINSCTGKPISLKNLKRLQELQIDLAYVPEQKKLVIFPHLRAAGKDDPIAQVAAKALNPKPPVSWTPPPINETPGKLSHMFRRRGGSAHFSEDTPENRAYILTAVSDPANKGAVNKQGVEMYWKVMPDGYLSWAHVESGKVVNGGRGKPWFKWIADPKEYSGGSMKPRPPYSYFSDKFTFQERIQADRLTKVYNASVRNNPWPPHPTESKNAGRDVGGVRHQTGIILDLLKELEEGVYDEYMFFLPAVEGESPLSKEEILQIVREIAQGIYIHDTIPFFSLNMNADHQLYPIIHPAYQNTYVGYVISMLDYHLKEFWTGQLFEEGFVEKWNKNPRVEEGFLRKHSFSIKEFANFDDTIRNLLKAEKLSSEQMASMSECQVTFSCRMIGKQKGINKTENLFVLDSDVELVHSVEWTPVGEEQETCFRILDQACGILCEQIKEKGFARPEMKKWLDALKVMNFFSCYFRTLQEGDKIPRFQESLVVGKEKVCPPIFPPIPYPHGPFVEFRAEDVFKSLSSSGKKVLKEYYQMKQENTSYKEHVKSILAEALKSFSVKERSSDQLSQEELIVFVDAMMDVIKARYLFVQRDMDKLFVDLKIKTRLDESAEKLAYRIHMAQFSAIDLVRMKTEETISFKKSWWGTFEEETKLLESLPEKKKIFDKALDWVQDPLSVLVGSEKWFFDLNHRTLGLRTKNSASEIIKVFGGYEPTLEDTESKRSVLASRILKTHAKRLSKMEEEEFLSLGEESGLLFKLPIEDSFPVSSHGIPYNTMMLTSSPKNSSEEAFLSAIHAIIESDRQAFTNVEKEIVDWNQLDAFGKSAIHYASVAGWNRSRVLGAKYIASKGEISYVPGADWDPADRFGEHIYMKINGSFFILQDLINKKADLLIKDSQGWTALHYAAAAGNYIALAFLLKAEKKLLNIPALNGETPLYLAVQKNRLSCARMLLGAEADLSIKPMHGWNVLMSAIHNGHEEMALFLVKTGKIDLEYSWRGGKTALHFAIEMQMEKLLEELLKLGVDRNRTYNGQNPISLASTQNWQKGIELLNSISEKAETPNSGCLVM